jgi:cytoskeletal protein RodZ
MSAPSTEDHLDPNDPMSYAPRWIREEAKSRSAASGETKINLPQRIVATPSSFDTFSEALGKSRRNRLDPEFMHTPPVMSQWSELIPVMIRLAAAAGVSALVALLLVFVIPASRERAQDHVQDVNASAAPESVKAAVTKQAPREGEAKPAESKPSLASDRTAQPADPAKTNDMTHEQSEELLHQFVRWQQKLNSTDAPPQ